LGTGSKALAPLNPALTEATAQVPGMNWNNPEAPE
jgi:hypothetical protein